METKSENDNYQLISYMTLRKLLGLLGIVLPFVLLAGAYLLDELNIIQPSISHYYHTVMRDVLVIVVASFGLFLFTYKGEAKIDGVLSNIAGICAVCVALFPTNELGSCQELTCYIHFIAAMSFFIILAYMSYFIFTLSNNEVKFQTPQKRKRNVVYKICSSVMFFCILILAAYFLVFKKSNAWPESTVFIFEAIALIAFGISWLTKGEAIFGDK